MSSPSSTASRSCSSPPGARGSGAWTPSAPERQLATLYFEDYEVGYTARAGPYLVREGEVIEFGEGFDPRSFHTDPEAARDSVFGGLVASGCHVFCIRSWLSNRLPDQTALLAGLGSEKLDLPTPVRPGDEISRVVECLECRPSRSRPGTGLVKMRNEVRDQRRETVMRLVALMLVFCRGAD